MKDNVLFEITTDHLDTGLRGVPVGYCTTSHVDPIKGLSYVGRPIAELAYREPLEVIFLLVFGKMPSKHELDNFEKDIAKRANCKRETIEAIENLPKAGHPMDVFAAALLITGMYEGTNDYRQDCLNVIAKLPIIAATVINSHAGLSSNLSYDSTIGYVENFVKMLQIPSVKSNSLIEVMKIFYILHLDHGGGNLSTFVGKAVASGLEHMYGSLSAAMTALAGPRHGRANQDCLEFVQELLNQLGDRANQEDVEHYVRQKLENKELVHGFGHAVLRVEDARATVCYQYCQKHFAEHPLVKLALLLRTEGSKVLKENPKITDPYPNIDAITGTMLTAAGFEYPEYFTVLFGFARCVGIAIQIVYERLEARSGKGTPIIRPNYLYKSRA